MNSRFIFLSLLILLGLEGFSQVNSELMSKDSISINAPTFLIGTLSDYMGRYKYIDRETQVDRYYKTEIPLRDYMTEFISINFAIEVDTIEGRGAYQTFSSDMAKIINGYYSDDINLIDSKFDTKEKKMSFISGVYFRYGLNLNDTIYCIRLANSPKHQNCYTFLKEIGCKRILFKRMNTRPTGFELYFEPTEALKLYFKSFEKEKQKLLEYSINKIGSNFLDSLNMESLQKIKPAFE